MPSRALRPQIFHTLAFAGLLAACTVGTGTTPTPTGSPTPTGNPTPTAAPTATPSPTFNPEQIAHPTGATDIVLRMDQGGGMIFGWMATQAPTFTLYGDGTVVFRPLEDPERPFIEQGLPRFLTGGMTEEGIQALLLYALDTGRLANAKPSYEDPRIADAGTTIFNLNAGGEEKVVTVYALAEAPDEQVPDAADRAGFAQLANLLNNFEQEAQSGTVDELTLYDPDLYRATMFDGMGEPTTEPIAWPWEDLTPADFPSGDEPGGTKVLDREQAAKLTEVPSGGVMSIWVEAEDGTLYSFAVRPLLPDEVAAFEAL